MKRWSFISTVVSLLVICFSISLAAQDAPLLIKPHGENRITLKQGSSVGIALEIPIDLDFYAPGESRFRISYVAASQEGSLWHLMPEEENSKLIQSESALRVEAVLPLGCVGTGEGKLQVYIEGLQLSMQYNPVITFQIEGFDPYLVEKFAVNNNVRQVRIAAEENPRSLEVSFSQLPPFQPRPSSDYQEDIMVRLFLTDLAVKDKDGKFVRGLKPEDFVVKLDEKIVEHFSLDEFNNSVVDDKAAPPALHIIVLDMMNLKMDGWVNSRKFAVQYIEKLVAPGDKLACFALTRQLSIIEAMSADKEKVISKIKNFRLPASRQKDDINYSLPKEFKVTKAMGESLAELAKAFKAQPTIDYFKSFRDMVTIYEKVPGRKNLLLFSEGKRKDLLNKGHEKYDWYRFLDTLNRCKTSFYPINRSFTPEETGKRLKEAGLVSTEYTVNKDKFQESLHTPYLEEIARDTRGIYFHNDVSDEQVLSAMKAELANYYQMGFRLKVDGDREKYNSLQIRAKNSNYQVSHRKNLYTPKSYSRLDAKERAFHLEEGFLYNSKKNELGVKFVHCLEFTETGKFLHLDLAIPAQSILLNEGEAELQMVIHLEDPDSNRITHLNRIFRSNENRKGYQHLRCSIPVVPNEFSCWVAVRDNKSGKRSYWNFHTRKAKKNDIHIQQPRMLVENKEKNMAGWRVEKQEFDTFSDTWLTPKTAILCSDNFALVGNYYLHFTIAGTGPDLLAGSSMSLKSEAVSVEGEITDLFYHHGENVSSFNIRNLNVAAAEELILTIISTRKDKFEIRFPLKAF